MQNISRSCITCMLHGSFCEGLLWVVMELWDTGFRDHSTFERWTHKSVTQPYGGVMGEVVNELLGTGLNWDPSLIG